MANLDSILKSRDITLPTKVCIVKAMVFSIVMYWCENWTIRKLSTKELMLQTVVKALESPLYDKEIKPVNPKGNQPWIVTGRTDAKAEAAMLWPPDVKSWLIGKDHDAGKDWGQEEKGTTEDEMAGWHHHSMDISMSKLWELVTGKPGVLQFMGLQRVGHDWETELTELSGKESACQCRRRKRWGLIPGSERPPEGGQGNSLQYSCLENPHGQRSLVGYSP